jgi:hypothetical protein
MLAACSTTSGSESQQVSVIAAAAATTQAAGTAEIDTTYTTSGSSSITDRTLYDFQRQIGEVIPSSDPGGGNQPEEILDGATSYKYFSSNPTAAIDLRGKSWLADQLRHLAGPGIQALNPATIFGRIAPIVQTARKVGNQFIDGVETTRYDLTVSAKAMKEILGYDPALEVSFEPASIYIDAQHRLRRIRISYTLPDGVPTTATSDYVRFGIPVNVTIPPANQVVTLKQYENDICTAMNSQGAWAGVGQPIPFGVGTDSQLC